jgi:signal transduction histidine kinase
VEAWNTGKPAKGTNTTYDGRIWSVTGWPISNGEGKITGVIEVTREITAQKEAEIALQEAKDRAELYLDLLGHDLNNIHQGLIIGLELALQDDHLPRSMVKQLEVSLEQVNRGVGLISNVQKFAAITDKPPHLEPTMLVPVVEFAVKTVTRAFPLREIKVNLESPDEEITVIADEFLGDAIFNLLHNTVKHDKSKTVVVDIKIRYLEESNQIVLQVDDRGPGLDAESKKVLLSRMESGFKVRTGMGLTLVKRIIDRYGGRIVLEDRVPGDYTKGACFMLFIPRA